MSTPVLYFEDDFIMGNYEESDKKEEKTNNTNNEKKVQKKEKKEEQENKITKHNSLGLKNIKRNNNITKVSFDEKIDVIDVESYKEFNKLLFINNLIEEENEESMCKIF